MTSEDKNEQAALDRLADAMLHDLLNASDEDILTEFNEDHGDPARHAAEMRALFEKKLIADNKKRLVAAKAALTAGMQLHPVRPPMDITDARRRLHAALRRPGVMERLTMAARKEGELSDADVIGMLEALHDLGLDLVDPRDP